MVTVKTSPPNHYLNDDAIPFPSFFTSLFTPYSHTYIHNQTSLQQQQPPTENKAMAAGGGGKSDDFQPFPVKDQLPGVDFCLSSSPSWRMLTTFRFLFFIFFSFLSYLFDCPLPTIFILALTML